MCKFDHLHSVLEKVFWCDFQLYIKDIDVMISRLHQCSILVAKQEESKSESSKFDFQLTRSQKYIVITTFLHLMDLSGKRDLISDKLDILE